MNLFLVHKLWETLKAFFLKLNFEALIWISGMLFLFIIPSGFTSGEGHFSLCLFNNLGIDFCPGCGLGTSVSYLLHLNFNASLDAHPLGIPALLIILHRIVSLLRNNVMPFNPSAEIKTGVSNG